MPNDGSPRYSSQPGRKERSPDPVAPPRDNESTLFPVPTRIVYAVAGFIALFAASSMSATFLTLGIVGTIAVFGVAFSLFRMGDRQRSRAFIWWGVGLAACVSFGGFAGSSAHRYDDTGAQSTIGSAATDTPATEGTVAATRQGTDSETAAPTERPRPVDWHARRAVAQRWWAKRIASVMIADAAFTAARDAVANDNLVAASSFMQKAHAAALDASNTVSEDVPAGWDDVKEHFGNAMADYASGYDRMHGAIDSRKPSDMAAAVDDTTSANAEFAESVHLARVHYVAMGGKWSDVSDGSEEMSGIEKVMHAAAGGN